MLRGQEQAHLQEVVALPIACPIHGYPQVLSYAYLMSLAFEALGWCPQPTLPIDGERSRKVWRVLGTGDAHLTRQRCWRSQPHLPVSQAFLSKFPTAAGTSPHLTIPYPPLTPQPRHPWSLSTILSAFKPFILFNKLHFIFGLQK